jgi:hypothetical protein
LPVRNSIATAEYQDYLSSEIAHLVAAVRLPAQQMHDIVEHPAGLEEADRFLFTALDGEQPPGAVTH